MSATLMLLLLLYVAEVAGFFLISSLVLLKPKDDVQKRFGHFALLLGLWQLLQLLAQLFSENTIIATDLLFGSIWTSGVLATGFLVFACAYTGKKILTKSLYLLGYAVGSISIFSKEIANTQITVEGIGIPKLDIWYGIVLGFAFVCVLIGVVLIVIHYFTTRDKFRKNQDAIVLTSTFFSAVVVILSSFHTGAFSSSVIAEHIVPTMCLFTIICLLFAMRYYRLFDVRGIVVRALLYTTSILFLGLLYVAPSVYLVGIVLMGFPFVLYKFIAGVIVGTMVAMNYEKIRVWFDARTARIFFRDSYDPALMISEINKVLVTTVDLEVLLTLCAGIISKNLKSESCIFVLSHDSAQDARTIGVGFSPKSYAVHKLVSGLSRIETSVVVTGRLGTEHLELRKTLIRDDVSVLVRIGVQDSREKVPLGYLMLGDKKSGNDYTEQDLRTLETISDALIIAIQNALRFEEIQNFNLTLQQQVADATLKLRKTNAKLVALDETKDDFISMASHQLRTPLTAVKGYVSMVLEEDAGKVTPMQRKMLNQAYMSSQRMVYLIADLLNVSRLKTGKFEIERTPVNLAHMIAEEIGQLREQAASRSLKLTYDKPKDFPALMLDETKTRQVVMNFIDNAIHYTRAGGHIQVELRERPHAIELRVVDDGIGVPRTEQHHLFTKFYRAVNAQRERPDGTGLGLFMAKKVILAQGGAVIFESREGKGSTFGFTLPREKLAVKE